MNNMSPVNTVPPVSPSRPGAWTMTSPAVCAGPTSRRRKRRSPTCSAAAPLKVRVGGRWRTPSKSKGAKISAK
jgi:hypothetical protein